MPLQIQDQESRDKAIRFFTKDGVQESYTNNNKQPLRNINLNMSRNLINQ